MLLESGSAPTFVGLVIIKMTSAVSAVHVEAVSAADFLIVFSPKKRMSVQVLGQIVHDLHVDGDNNARWFGSTRGEDAG